MIRAEKGCVALLHEPFNAISDPGSVCCVNFDGFGGEVVLVSLQDSFAVLLPFVLNRFGVDYFSPRVSGNPLTLESVRGR